MTRASVGSRSKTPTPRKRKVEAICSTGDGHRIGRLASAHPSLPKSAALMKKYYASNLRPCLSSICQAYALVPRDNTYGSIISGRRRRCEGERLYVVRCFRDFHDLKRQLEEARAEFEHRRSPRRPATFASSSSMWVCRPPVWTTTIGPRSARSANTRTEVRRPAGAGSGPALSSHPTKALTMENFTRNCLPVAREPGGERRNMHSRECKGLAVSAGAW